jgi:hypothetical protein
VSGSGRNSFCTEQIALFFGDTFSHTCCCDMRLLDLELCLEVVAEHFFLSGPRVSQKDSSRGGSSRRGTACSACGIVEGKGSCSGRSPYCDELTMKRRRTGGFTFDFLALAPSPMSLREYIGCVLCCLL